MPTFEFIEEIERELWSFFRASEKSLREVSPPADVYELPELFIIRIEMPGLDRDTLSVSLEGDNLIVRGSKKNFVGTRGIIFHQVEIDYSNYFKAFKLPENADTDRIKATYRDGHLYIAIPKKPERAKGSKKIQIERG